jgi:threonine/homoserine/homoserine lactone efflux protein
MVPHRTISDLMVRWDEGGSHDAVERDPGFGPGRAMGRLEAPHEGIDLGGVRAQGPDLVVGPAGQVHGINDRGFAPQAVLESCGIRWGSQPRRDPHLHRATDRGRRHPGGVPGDHATRLELADPLLGRRRAEVDAVGQRLPRLPTGGQQGSDDTTVNVVQHRGFRGHHLPGSHSFRRGDGVQSATIPVMDVASLLTASGLLESILPAAAGAAAGFAVAVPLGPVGLLIVHRAASRGVSAGLGAASGVAVVDLLYAAIVVAAGVRVVAAMEPFRDQLTLVSAVLLAAIGGYGIASSVRPHRRRDGQRPPATPLVRTPADAGTGRTFGRSVVGFSAITAINPATVVYFAALTVGLGDRLGTTGPQVAFATAVGVASLVWQSLLVAFGVVLGRAARPGLSLLTRLAGSVLILVLAILIWRRGG